MYDPPTPVFDPLSRTRKKKKKNVDSSVYGKLLVRRVRHEVDRPGNCMWKGYKGVPSVL